jgi:hypothetical protein
LDPEAEETSRSIPEHLEDALRKYALGSAEAPRANAKPVAPDMSPDTEFLRGIHAKESLWRNTEFYWRLLLSRREIDLVTREDRLSFGRSMAYYFAQSEIMHGLLERLQSRWLGMVLIAGVATAALTLQFFKSPYPADTAVAAFVAPFVFAAICGALALILTASRTVKPHGLRNAERCDCICWGRSREASKTSKRRGRSSVQRRGRDERYCISIFPALITFAHFAVSALMYAPNCSGPMNWTSTP